MAAGGYGGGRVVLLVVRDTVLPEISSEVARLQNDLNNEGYVAKIKSWSVMDNVRLWDYLRVEYWAAGKAVCGAILIGHMPLAQNTKDGHVTDLAYWNMAQFGDVGHHDIWVSRIAATSSGAGGWPAVLGNEVLCIKRALQANHDYRTGAHRLPHTAHYYIHAGGDQEGEAHRNAYNYWYPSNGGNALGIWPVVRRTPVSRCLNEGGELYDGQMHGNSGPPRLVDELGRRRLHASQVRFCLFTSCSVGLPGQVVNQNLVTYGGGNVLSVGATADTEWNGFNILYEDAWYCNPAYPGFRSALAAGRSWGDSLVSFNCLVDKVRPIFHGDLSLRVKMAPANQVPVIDSFRVDKVAGAAPLTVNFSVDARDPDGAVTNYEWFVKAFDGISPPEYAGGSARVIAHTYTLPHRYKAEVQVVDNYKARTWARAEIVVGPQPNAPLRVRCGMDSYRPFDFPGESDVGTYRPNEDYTAPDGRIWLHDQPYTNGTWGLDGLGNGGGGAVHAPVDGATDDYPYYYFRTDDKITYRIPVQNGVYRLLLNFADMQSTSAGQRIMDVSVEGVLKVKGLDVFGAVGGRKVYTVVQEVNVADGELTFTVDRNASSPNKAFLNCFEVLPQSVPVNRPPVITAQPRSATVAAGSPSSFSVTATGTAPLKYQWQKDGVDVPGATAAMYIIVSATAADAGTYACVVANAGGRATSSSAALTVNVEEYKSEDVGGCNLQGYSRNNGTTYTVAGCGGDIGLPNGTDQFHFLHFSRTGDVTIIARVDSVSYANYWSEGGLMIRDGTAANAKFAMVFQTPDNAVRFQWRSSEGYGWGRTPAGDTINPKWLKLVRSGNQFSGYYSVDGVQWQQVLQTQTIPMSPVVEVGLAVTSHNLRQCSVAQFSNVSIIAGEGVPSPWIAQDIGGVGLTGSAACNKGVFTLQGSGAAVWAGCSDQLRYVYQIASGDCEIKARVVSVENVESWSRVGVMVRETLADNARNAVMFTTPSIYIGTIFQWRNVTGAMAPSRSAPIMTFPFWLKLVRAGNTFTGYRSQDGETWFPVGAQSVNMPPNVYIGLVAISHNNSRLCTGVMDSVMVVP